MELRHEEHRDGQAQHHGNGDLDRSPHPASTPRICPAIAANRM